MSKQSDGANDSSDPSTSPSSGASPAGGKSTPLTPLTSGGPSPASDKDKLHNENKTAATRWPSISEINEAASHSDTNTITILPSIKTVEATSAAKIYLELYFNSIFRSRDPRQQRQLELEQHIYAYDLTPEERLMTRHNWVLRENDYLRQCRVLRSNRYSTQSESAITVAGYKAIKILGKGSFGVVRLVREIGCDLNGSHEDDPLTLKDNVHSRSNPLGALMSAVEGARQSRRRYMTGEKKEVYAMKVIKKAEMIRNSQEGHIRAERDFLVTSESSRWVVPLIASFQDANNLYLVMDYMVGGDFLGLLIRKDTLREDWARFYVAEMILCIEEAHRLFWIHRDVKPDNFLISASGHLKISDFGLAFNGHWSHDQAYYNSQRYSLLEKLDVNVKGDSEDQKEAAEARELAPEIKLHSPDDYILHKPSSTSLLDWRDSKGRRRFAKSVVGTSQYMAPEVIRGEMYDGRCDWWSLGIILYEVGQYSRFLCIKFSTAFAVSIWLYALCL
jgi:serine/threonine protein kinase